MITRITSGVHFRWTTCELGEPGERSESRREYAEPNWKRIFNRLKSLKTAVSTVVDGILMVPSKKRKILITNNFNDQNDQKR